MQVSQNQNLHVQHQDSFTHGIKSWLAEVWRIAHGCRSQVEVLFAFVGSNVFFGNENGPKMA